MMSNIGSISGAIAQSPMPKYRSMNIPEPLWGKIEQLIEEGHILFARPAPFIVATIVQAVERISSAPTKDPQDDD